jgi:ribosomal protein S18 acetylase RimI-like enzyme
MIFRQATQEDIPAMQVVRNAVKENVLSDPSVITNDSYIPYLEERGMGWVCSIKNQIVGFAILDNQEKNVWALFVLPNFEGRGIAQELQRIMLKEYFAHTQEAIWLGTAPNTRAENFYRESGWKEVGMHGQNELKFEMTYDVWNSKFNRRLL